MVNACSASAWDPVTQHWTQNNEIQLLRWTCLLTEEFWRPAPGPAKSAGKRWTPTTRVTLGTLPLTCMVAVVWGIEDVRVVQLAGDVQSLHQLLHEIVNREQSLPPGNQHRVESGLQGQWLHQTPIPLKQTPRAHSVPQILSLQKIRKFQNTVITSFQICFQRNKSGF